MDNQEIKRRSRGIFFLWLVIAAVCAGGAFLASSHFEKRAGIPSDFAADSASSTAIASQTFSGDGYVFIVPATWYVEQTGKNSVAVYPDYSPTASSSDAVPAAMCKLEMSVFPYASDTDMADWISARLGADPSVAVAERSGENISVTGGAGVRWNGTIDDVPTTLVYLFSADHAFEIAPSVVNQTTGDGNSQCENALETFLSQLTLN